MAHPLLLLATLVQVQQPAQQPAIARIVVTPANPTVEAQDTLRLQAQAEDAQGNPVPGARIRFISAGGRFEGVVEEDGLVRSGATGILPVTVLATVPGGQTLQQRVEVRMVPGPAGRVEIAHVVTKLLAGQRVHLVGASFSLNGDRREDRIVWRSS